MTNNIGTDAQASDVDDTLNERGSRYGEFKYHAKFSERLLNICQKPLWVNRHEKVDTSWESMEDDQKECLKIVMHKVARILNGDPDYSDNWHDIAGYCLLVDKRLKAEGK